MVGFAGPFAPAWARGVLLISEGESSSERAMASSSSAIDESSRCVVVACCVEDNVAVAVSSA